MKNLLRLSIVLLLATFLPEFASAWTAPRERLTYNIMYKWGLINKKAGEVALATSGVGSPAFKSTLTAASAPWADHIYHVRDTLLGTIDTSTLMPSRYERIAHEGGRFSHDILDYSRSGNTTTAKARVWRKKKKEPMDYDERTHQAEGPTLDMLSSFYFMRSIDYAKMKAGESVRLNIFSGKKKEFLTIHYRGRKTRQGAIPCLPHHLHLHPGRGESQFRRHGRLDLHRAGPYPPPARREVARRKGTRSLFGQYIRHTITIKDF